MSINPKNILKSRAILVHRRCKIIKYLSASFWTPGICKPSSSREQTSFSTESSSWEACELVLGNLVFSNLSFEKRCTRRVCVWDLGSRNPAGEPYKKLRKATNLGNLGYGFPAERCAFEHLQDTRSDAELRATCDNPVATCCPPKTCTLNTWRAVDLCRCLSMFIYVYALRGQSRSTVSLYKVARGYQRTLKTTTKIFPFERSLWKSHPSDFHPGQHNVWE